MRKCLIRFILMGTMLGCSAAAISQPRYRVIQIPDSIQAQALTRDGRVLGLDWRTGVGSLWDKDTGITTITAPDGNKWSRLSISPGGYLLGQVLLPDQITTVYYRGQFGSPLELVVWPEIFPATNPGTGAYPPPGGITICISPCTTVTVISTTNYFWSPPRYSANAINDAGTIAGVASVFQPGQSYAIRVKTNGEFDVLADPNLQAIAINKRGDALVTAPPMLINGSNDVELWTVDGQRLKPDLLSGYTSILSPVMNDQGQIAGTDYSDQFLQGFLWTPGYGSLALDSLPGYTNTVVNGMNGAGITVGLATNLNLGCCIIAISNPATSVGVIWYPNGHTLDLNSLIRKHNNPNPSDIASIAAAITINDAGQILVYGNDTQGVFHTYLLIPRADRKNDSDARNQDDD